MRMLVLGAGLQGSACAFDLLRSAGVERVVIADVRVSDFPPFLENLRSVGHREGLIGCEVRDTHDALVGRVSGVEGTLERSYLVVARKGGEAMIPMGRSLAGFLVSSATVLTASNPM